MSLLPQATVGRVFTIAVAITMDGSDTNTPPADTEFTEIGGTRDLSYGTSFDSADTTSRSSGLTTTALNTFANRDITINGIYLLNDDIQRALEDHLDTPPDSMNGQSYLWVRIFEPRPNGAGQVVDTFSIMSSFQKSANHSSEVTWDTVFKPQIDPVKTAVPAP